MKKIVLTFGLIAGFLEVAMLIITIPLYKNGTLQPSMGEVVGYTTMVVAMSMIFFGIKSYRDNYLDGRINFGKAFQVGMLIAGVASFLYVIGWEIDYNLVFPDFMKFYGEAMIKKETAAGASAERLAKISEQIQFMEKVYRSPVLRVGMTLLEILPVGLLFALGSAAILQRKKTRIVV